MLISNAQLSAGANGPAFCSSLCRQTLCCEARRNTPVIPSGVCFQPVNTPTSGPFPVRTARFSPKKYTKNPAERSVLPAG